MMNAVEASGHSPLQAGGVHPGKGLHLGHMRGTAEGPPGLRPQQAETLDYVRASEKGMGPRKAESRNTADLATVFDRIDSDGDGQLGRTEFYEFAKLAARDGLEALLAGIGGDGGGGDDDDAAFDPLIGVAPTDAEDGDTPNSVAESGGAGDDTATGSGAGATGGVAAPPAPEVVETGDPVFDLTLSGVAGSFVQDGGAEAALTLLEAAQGYSEAASAA